MVDEYAKLKKTQKTASASVALLTIVKTSEVLPAARAASEKWAELGRLRPGETLTLNCKT